MAIIMCSNGHYYDNEKFFQCPYCGISFDFIKESGTNLEDSTVRLSDVNTNDEDRTISFWKSEENNRDYITGWLVCIDGPEKGRDYRLHYGFNRIGRSYQMDICIEDDMQITRDNHCSIAYDVKENEFSVMPSTGTLTYLNDQMLMENEKIKDGDKIRIGQTTLEFVAFCKGEKRWDEKLL